MKSKPAFVLVQSGFTVLKRMRVRLVHIASLHVTLGKNEHAEPSHKRAMETTDANHGKDNPSLSYAGQSGRICQEACKSKGVVVLLRV